MAGSLQALLGSVANPDLAALRFEQLMQSLGLYGQFHQLGMALLTLFALAEVYRIWFGGAGGERELALLGVKIAVVAYLITGAPSPIEQLAKAAYRPFAELGNTIASQGGGQAYNDLLGLLGQSLGVGPQFGFFDVLGSILGNPSNLINAVMWALLWVLFLVVFAVVLALYVFAVLGSRIFLVIAILAAPLLLPMMLWRPVANFMSRWVGVVLHAMFMPLIGALTLYAALELGMLAPLQAWASCVAPGSPGTQCAGGMIGGVISAIIGGLVAVFLMLSVDRVVTGFLGAAEVTASGLLAARWAASAAGAPVRALQAAGATQARQSAQDARAMRVREELVTTQDLGGGTVRRTTMPIATPQA